MEIINLLSSSPEPVGRKIVGEQWFGGKNADRVVLELSDSEEEKPVGHMETGNGKSVPVDTLGGSKMTVNGRTTTANDQSDFVDTHTSTSIAKPRTVNGSAEPYNFSSITNTSTSKGGNDFFFLEDDFDSSINLENSIIQPPSSGLLGLNRKQMEEERLARLKRKTHMQTNDGEADAEETTGKKRKASLSPAPDKLVTGTRGEDLDMRLAPSSDPFASSPAKLDASLAPSSDPFASSPVKMVSNGARKIIVDNDPLVSSPIKHESKPRRPSKQSDDDPFGSDPPLPLSNVAPNLPSKTSHIPKESGYKRSVSNIETSKTKPKVSGLARSKSTIVESDPILFTSSPVYHAEITKKKEKRKTTSAVDVDDDEEDIFGLNSPKKDSFLYSSDDSFPDIENLPAKTTSRSTKSNSPTTTSSKPKPSHAAPRTSLSKAEAALANYNASKEKEKRAEERKAKTADQAKEKEEEKERKRLAKEEKARRKEDEAIMTKVNALKTDKKISSRDMIVDLPSSLDEKVSRATKIFLTDLSVQVCDYESEMPIVKWRRKVEATYDAVARVWYPCAKHIKSEKHIMYILHAKEFVKLALGEEGSDIDNHVLHLKTKFENSEIIYLIEGLIPWQNKNKSLQSNKFQDAVRTHLPTAASSGTQRKTKKKADTYVDEDIIEHALLRMQIKHGVLVHHSRVANDTSEWIRAFTQQISTIPYKFQQQSLDTAFCMESGQVVTGTSPEDTFIKMLGTMARVTPPIARGIVMHFPTIGKLVAGLKKEGPLALAELRTAANNDGAFADRKIGQAVSRRVHTVFTSRDGGRDDV